MENKEIKTPIKSKRIMFYECQDCGVIYMMFLEKGLEEHNGTLHKPVPFGLLCRKCGGFKCFHRLGSDISFNYLIGVPDDFNYFKNYDDADCGMPIIKKPDFINSEEYYNFITLFYFGMLSNKLSFLVNQSEDCSVELVNGSNRENRRHKSDKWKESRYKRRPDKKYF